MPHPYKLGVPALHVGAGEVGGRQRTTLFMIKEESGKEKGGKKKK
ncbi:hypothetical protein [Pyrolobus fumarii]|nr:hypothetical protein [Pyrolobus fumarii]